MPRAKATDFRSCTRQKRTERNGHASTKALLCDMSDGLLAVAMGYGDSLLEMVAYISPSPTTPR